VRYLIIKSGAFSIGLHLALISLLVFSFNFSAPVMIPTPQANEDVIQAVAVQNDQVEKEIQRLQELEEEKIQKAEDDARKLKQIEEQARLAEQKRITEEKRLAEAQKQKRAEEQQRKAEQQKLAELKKQQQQAETKRLEEEEKTRLAEADRKREEELARKNEEERKLKEEQERQRIAEEQRKAEEEKQREEREAALQAQLEAEQKEQQAAQRRQDQQLLQQTVNGIYRRVVSNFNLSGLPAGLQCVLSIRLIPGGDVVNVDIDRSSGNDIFDRRAVTAVQKATPLPVPQDAVTFERLGLRQFNLVFKP
jgi:colicin import membrane protein